MNRREYIKNITLMLGYTVSTTAMMQLISSCKNKSHIDWKPIFFNEEQAALISEIAETILPETKTPGAISLGVPQLIDHLYAVLLNEDDKKNILEGLKSFEQDCNQKYNQAFSSLVQNQKETFLIEQDKRSPKFPISMWGIMLEPHPHPITFYRRIKGMVLMAYYTSEKIGKEVFVYDPVPGNFIGCVPLDNKNSYAE